MPGTSPGKKDPMIDSQFKENKLGELYYYTIPSFTETGLVKHGFSSRLGGVSQGEVASLNLGFKRKDSADNVKKNFQIICQALGIETRQMVFTDQVHKDRVALVDETDSGKGFDRPSDIRGCDGLITNRPGLALVTFYADCVPLYFLDPRQRAIGLAHSGWRSTLAEIGKKTLLAMQEYFATDPSDCLVGIGPSIGQCCFEVDRPVAELFTTNYPKYQAELVKKKAEKYHIDLWSLIRLQLINAGIREENITLASTCTACNNKVFFSHRADKGKTGSLAAFLMLV